MCTAISVLRPMHYFGRNLDLHHAYNETVTITPRNYPFAFRFCKPQKNHYTMIGMATVAQDYPLYYDAMNEFGLCIAGLNFPGNAVYQPVTDQYNCVTPFELIPWVLGQCKSVQEARKLLQNTQIVNIPFSDAYGLTPMHWILADPSESIVMEPMKDGLHIYDDPVGILTNNPALPYHLENLRHYTHLTAEEAKSSTWVKQPPVSFGTGAVGLPGDMSSVSRFVRAAFMKEHAVFTDVSVENVQQFFRLLQSVQQIKGTVRHDDQNHYTIYSSCCDSGCGIYYYNTYDNLGITAVNMHNEDLDSQKLICFPLRKIPAIHFEN